jgi:4-amino-4-deoxy-L-arabinose transferase-like glycosyltransferase
MNTEIVPGAAHGDQITIAIERKATDPADGVALAGGESRADRPMLLGTAVLGIFWALGATNFNDIGAHPETVVLLAAGIVVATAIARNLPLASWSTLIYAIAVGSADRVFRQPWAGSGVIPATKEAIGVLAHGGNPYDHYYQHTMPPGEPFAYPPGEIVFYAIPNAIFGGITRADIWAGVGVLLVLGSLAWLVGPARAALATALFGSFELAAYRATDGSNDTGFALLLVIAIALMGWSERAGHRSRTLFYGSAVFFAWTLLFKQYSILVYPFVVLYLRRQGADWRKHAAVAFGIPVIVSLPFLIMAPGRFIYGLTLGVSFHTYIWGLNIWATLAAISPAAAEFMRPLIPLITMVAVAILAIMLARRPTANLGLALGQGLSLFFVALVFARWTSSAYFVGPGAGLAAAVALLPATSARRGGDNKTSPAGQELKTSRPFSRVGSWFTAANTAPPVGPLVMPTIRPIIWSIPRLGRLSWVQSLLLTAVLIGAVFRFVSLDTVPPSLEQDEVVNGYDAYSLFLTGRDHLGHPISLAGLESYGDWVSPLLTFLTIPVVGLFGLNAIAIRSVSAALGVLAIPSVYLLAMELFQRRAIAVLAAWFIALSPWAVMTSRYAIPPATVPPMITVMLASILWTARRRSTHGIVAVALFTGLTILGYPTMKLYVPLLGIAVLVLYGGALLRIKKEAIGYAAFVLLLVAGPNLYLSARDPAGKARYDQLSVFNRIENVDAGVLAHQYWTYLSPKFLFLRGDTYANRTQPGHGMELWSILPFLLIGLGWLVWTVVRPHPPAHRRPAVLLLVALALYPIPGMLTTPAPHASRGTQAIPLLAILAAIGAVTAGTFVVRLLRRQRQPAQRAALIALWTLPIATLMTSEVVSRYDNYFNDYPKNWQVAWYFQYGLEETLAYARAHEAEYDEIWVTDTNQPYIYVAFFGKVNPDVLHRTLQFPRNPPNTNQVYAWGKYRFTFTHEDPPEELRIDRLSILYTAYSPGGDVTFEVRGGDTGDRGRILVIHQPRS